SDGALAIEPFARDLPPDYATVLRQAANLRMTLQSVQIHNFDAANGPNASYALDVRFGESALSALVAKDAPAFRAALMSYLKAASADRRAANGGPDPSE